MNNLLFSLAMAALGQFTGLGGGGFGGGGPGIAFGPGLGGPRYGGGYPGAIGPGIGLSGLGLPGLGMPGIGNPGYGNPGYGNPGYGNPGYGAPGGIAIAPRPYGSNPGGYGDGTSGSGANLQLASVAAARCLEQTGQLAPGESDALLRNQGRARGWPDGWQQGISDSQSERLLSRYGGCDGLLTALRQGRLGQGQRGGGLISQQPYGGAPSQPQGQPNSEAEAFGLAPYR